jgi:hypothetical protein
MIMIFILHSRLSLTSDGEDIIIPFDSKPIVSKFGPISRVIKPKPKSTDPYFSYIVAVSFIGGETEISGKNHQQTLSYILP